MKSMFVAVSKFSENFVIQQHFTISLRKYSNEKYFEDLNFRALYTHNFEHYPIKYKYIGTV